jgi:hypothetical protein
MNTTPNAKASARILALIAAGMSPVDALKTICGTETVDAMIDSLYTDLRTKGGR